MALLELKDLHTFFKTKKGIVTLVLENTYTPRLDLLYETRNDDSK